MEHYKGFCRDLEKDFKSALNLFWRDTRIIDVLKGNLEDALNARSREERSNSNPEKKSEHTRLPSLTNGGGGDGGGGEEHAKLRGLNEFVDFKTAQTIARCLMHIYASLPPENRCRLRTSLKWAFRSRADAALGVSQLNQDHGLPNEAQKFEALARWLLDTLSTILSANVARMVSPGDVVGREVDDLDPATQDKIRRKAQRRIEAVVDDDGQHTENELLLNTLQLDLCQYPAVRKQPRKARTWKPRKKKQPTTKSAASLPALPPIHPPAGSSTAGHKRRRQSAARPKPDASGGGSGLDDNATSSLFLTSAPCDSHEDERDDANNANNAGGAEQPSPLRRFVGDFVETALAAAVRATTGARPKTTSFVEDFVAMVLSEAVRSSTSTKQQPHVPALRLNALDDGQSQEAILRSQSARCCVSSWIDSGISNLALKDTTRPLSAKDITRKRRQTVNRNNRRKERLLNIIVEKFARCKVGTAWSIWLAMDSARQDLTRPLSAKEITRKRRQTVNRNARRQSRVV